jgi:hypothetical protein
MHFTHFVRGSIPEAEIIKHGNQLAQLVGFKAEMIFASFSASRFGFISFCVVATGRGNRS